SFIESRLADFANSNVVIVLIMTHFVLRYMFTQVLERALRAERILDWAEVDAATSGARVVATLRVHVAALKAALFKQIPRIIASDGDDVAEGWRSFLGLCTAFNTFDELHLKLS